MANFIARPNPRFSTNLNQAVNDTTSTTLNVNSVPAKVPCILIIDPGTATQEKVKVTATGSGTITVTRNFDGKGAFTHGFNATIVDYDSPEYIYDIADLLEQNFNSDYTPQSSIFMKPDFALGFGNFIVSGLTAPTSGSLATTITAGVAYYGGTRYAVATDGGHTYTASQDTYVDVNPATGAFTYNGVANGGTPPALTANSLRIAKVVTSGAAVTGVTQGGFDSNGVIIYPTNGTNAAKIQVKDTTEVQVNNTTTETTAYTQSITGNLLGAFGMLRIKLFGKILNNSGGSANLTINLKYGATTIATLLKSIPADSTNLYGLLLEAFIANTGATNAQKGGFAVSGASLNNGLNFGAYGTATEDSTANKTLTITVTWGTANASLTFFKEAVAIELL